MNTKKDTNENRFSFEENDRRGNVDFIFCGIHTFQFINHSNSNQGREGVDAALLSGSDGVVAPSEIGIPPGAERS